MVISILIFSLIITILNYFDVMDINTVKHLKLLAVIISSLIGGIYIGKCSSNKGYIQGLKVGGTCDIIMFFISLILFHKGFHKELIVYYVIIIISCVLGSIIGINKKKPN